MSGKKGIPLRAEKIVTAQALHHGAENTATIKLKNTVLDVKTAIPLLIFGGSHSLIDSTS